MGKKKTKRKIKPKKKLVLETQFDCVICNHERSVDVKMQKEAKVGILSCRICNSAFQATINPLSDPIDVYSEWVDYTEATMEIYDSDVIVDEDDNEDDYEI
ncbi:19349_t:CDS:2 [Entrophospora sp. SA101]|nr:19349_t:CDS:2 [Entrophospora sp. SA101]CAJ0823203.1 13001_t:CDS:2 [Entrophospora sp. SA101]